MGDDRREGAGAGLTLRLARHCRSVALLLLAGIFRNWSFEVLERRVSMLPPRQQVAITGSVLGLLLAAALVAAQFGPLGLSAYFLAVVLLAR